MFGDQVFGALVFADIPTSGERPQIYLSVGFPASFWTPGKPSADIEGDSPDDEWTAGKPR